MLNTESITRIQSEEPSKRSYSNPTRRKSDSRINKPIERVIKVISVCILVGSLSSAFYASQAKSPTDFLSVTAVALAVSGAALLAGSLLGFLFGIPKRLQHNSVNPSNQQSDSADQDISENISYQQNTNLEEISDWLTKILVGVGLTELSRLPEFLRTYANFTATGLGDSPTSRVFAVALLIYFMICGFLLTYLWTRRYLARAFQEGDLDSRFSQIEDKVAKNKSDVDGLSIALLQLNLQPGKLPVQQDHLNTVIKSVSPMMREQIYNQAYSILDADLTDPSIVIKFENTIPIFKALIASDPRNYVYHRELGYALLTQRQPNLAEAEAELTTAIQQRGDWKFLSSEHPDVYAEFYRARCRIMQDENFKEKKESTLELKEKILADLEVARNNPEVKRLMAEKGLISEWLKQNPSKPT